MGAVTAVGTSTFAGGIEGAGSLSLAGSATSTFANGISLSDGCFAIDNVCIGNTAVTLSSDANYNTKAGTGALTSLTSGSMNASFGYEAGGADTTGGQNAFIGTRSGRYNTGGRNNSFLGSYSGYYNILGSQNVFSGSRSGFYNITGSSDTFSGYESGFWNSTGSQNLFSGSYSGYSNQTGGSNVFLGDHAGYSNTTGSTTVAIGRDALYNSTVSSTTAIGFESLKANTRGIENTALGYQSGLANTLGFANSFVGYRAGRSNTTGGSNVFIGDNAGYSNTTASSTIAIGANAGRLYSGINDGNIFIGDSAGYNAGVAAYGLTFIGYQSGYNTTSGYGNTFSGYKSGMANTTGKWNTFSGYYAGKENVSGISNSFFGVDAGRQSLGTGNTLVGYGAGSAINSGSNNTAVGYNSGDIITNGAANTFIGSGADGIISWVSTSTALGYNAQVATSSSMILGAATGDGVVWVGTGTTSPAAKFSIQQTANTSQGGLYLAGMGGDARAFYMDASGVLSFAGGDTGTVNVATLNAAGAWTNASDISYKQNIQDLGERYGLQTLIQLKPRYYEMKGTNQPQIGFIAQELKPLVPEVVDGEEGKMGISYGNLAALTVQSIQDLTTILGIEVCGNPISTATSTECGNPISTTSSPVSNIILSGISSVRLDQIESDILALKNASSSASSIIHNSLLGAVTDWVGNSISAVPASFKDLISDKITVVNLNADVISANKILSNKGVVVKDKTTGENYCIFVDNGVLKNTAGDCESAGVSSDLLPPAVSENINLTINGNNPAEIFVGDTYNDLGVIAVDGEGHDLSVQYFVNGIKVEQISLDTSTSTTYTIDYVARDGAENTATSTRTVIVKPRESSLFVPSVDEPFVGDVATSSDIFEDAVSSSSADTVGND
ncbi:MAG: hypothetical protein A3B08_02150 [Candidatus Taylorbacteria bacterium RIFCSPLOWO2_01_FULL_43_44]|uniref:Peptidase S74 domain-containing protein n=1 Tax=Candidatus Taylorbacteria bacterium RIFCSPHIGHO2_02_FULL_43_32b TaxID=1802306 RepID=A0A1G2MGU9_9BACT|nr:MAG: hypothetical protein A2743_04465 [Candidatus Taylorbacteria bacterium RIFCSPHIGHO2_01_FULL_43_47]OHA23155.1 MAG: hypothetical protein A3C72_01430 [Candidatus Taylorbacteria bacterium RIFCSPHIGHO2_02_FULL_43_32b]OHA29976.1 MAG: hypothetical protein A3B08_02150 [Candidatus Taylorbacteria bacterium RIFCSPLOWO2_01_FULL_43_44]